MRTLVEYYTEREQEFREQLEGAETIEGIARAIRAELQRLSAIDGKYIGQLSVPQARRAKKMLGIMRACFNILGTIELDVSKDKAILRTSKLSDLFRQMTTLAREFAALAKESAARILRLPPDSDSPTGKIRPFNEVHQPDIYVDADVLSKYLRQALDAIDKIVVSSDTYVDIPTPVFDDQSKLLEYMQCLLGDRHNKEDQLPDFICERLDEIPQVLSHYGIRVKYFEPGAEPTSNIKVSSMFIVRPSLNPARKDFVTQRPAFIQGDDQVVLRGLVFGPASHTET